MNKLFLIYGLVRVAGVSLKTRKEIDYSASAKKFRTPRPVGKSSQRMHHSFQHAFTVFLQNTEAIPHCRPLCPHTAVGFSSLVVFVQDWEATARTSLEVKLRTCPCMEAQFSFLALNSGAELAYSLTKYSLNSRLG